MLPINPESRSQKLHSPLIAGARVRARGAAWRVRLVQPFDACTIVHLAGIDRDNAGEHRTLLDPFDRLQPERPPAKLRVVRKRRWCRALKELLASDHPFDGLRTAASARIDLLPFQLEPALAMVRGLTCRLLLADEVGLGKTIQAGLIIAELRERGFADHVLILTPAGLRRQWQAELSDRFSIAATIVDSPLLRRRASSLPVGTSPWLPEDIAIASIDLVKRPEAMRGLASIVWDLLVIDEAHLTAQATHRRAAAHLLARRSRRVVLMTATPHAGDSEAFAALCRTGELDGEPLAVFRRARPDVGLITKRRVRTLPITVGPEEARMHDLLRQYAELVVRDGAGARRDALLAVMVLLKRALSDPASLRISIDRRLRLLSQAEPPAETQLLLPLLDEEADERDLEPLSVLAAPGLADRSRELALLREIQTAADAVDVGRKMQVLARLLTRMQEPALVFTEYRDTLQHVAATLRQQTEVAVIHGGLTEAERIQAQTAFTSGAARVLVATDAAGEGLNLQARCRLVINLELPWNPMRLEQRIGRVDRLGQAHTVHAINLYARGTAEGDVLARLVKRLDRARHAVGSVNDPVGVLSDDLVDALFENAETGRDPGAASLWRPDLQDAAESEARRLHALRRVGTPAASLPDQDRTPVTVMRHEHLKGLVPSPSIVWLIRTRIVDANGQLVEQLVIPLVIQEVRLKPDATKDLLKQPADVRALMQPAFASTWPTLTNYAAAITEDRLRRISDGHMAVMEMSRNRELALIQEIQAEGNFLFQPGLFERRAERHHEAAAQHRAIALEREAVRLRQLDAAGDIVVADDPELIMALVIAGR